MKRQRASGQNDGHYRFSERSDFLHQVLLGPGQVEKRTGAGLPR